MYLYVVGAYIWGREVPTYYAHSDTGIFISRTTVRRNGL